VTPRIELLWWEGCPSTERALAELRAAMADAGVDGDVALREIRTDEQAVAEGFTGSPTILVDGVELMALLGRAPDDDEPAALNCRIYRRRDGRIAPTPDPLDLREALDLTAAARTATP
jgi:hypothetical protein